jgi:hypothetical protein
MQTHIQEHISVAQNKNSTLTHSCQKNFLHTSVMADSLQYLKRKLETLTYCHTDVHLDFNSPDLPTDGGLGSNLESVYWLKPTEMSETAKNVRFLS